MDLGLRDTVAFIAGASRGIGLAIARAFLSEGARVIITGRDGKRLKKASSILTAKIDAKHLISLQGDMTDPKDIQRAIDKTVSTFGGIDHVVANVGSGAGREGWDLDPEDWELSLKTNLTGGMILATKVLPRLTARGGSITFISSIAGCESMNAPVTYSAAKAALQSAMKNLSRRVGSKGVRVNAVAPGNVHLPGGSWARLLAKRKKFYEEYVKSEVPMQRFGRPEEIADAVIFLASERAQFITGVCLVVDGGQTRSF